MAGFIRSNLTDIKFLRNLFNSETNDLLVLKEIIQNADDSKANFVVIGCTEGIADADHPLLQAPALFAVNDGPLSQEDAKAIISLGLSTKGGDASTVGKFGLGLKSVFYLSEALFFLDARLPPEDVWPHAHFDILSPWLGGEQPFRPEWAEFSAADRRRILARLQQLGLPDGFVVWVPLRRKLDCQVAGNERLAPIIPNYPGDESFRILPETVRDVGALLPMMGHVQHISLKPRPDAATPRMKFERWGTKRTADFKEQRAFDRSFSGFIQKDQAEAAVYLGTEVLLEDSALTALNTSDYWPTTEVTTPFGDVQEKDPSVPHGAALWQRTTGKAGSTAELRAQWSVFLPVEQAFEPQVLAGPDSYTLTLHGYFFLKPDRKSIYTWTHGLLGEQPDSEERMRQHWNGQLATKATLPFVLDGLSKITLDVADGWVSDLTARLRNSPLGQDHLDALTSRHQWARIWQEGAFRWTLLEPQIKFLPLPDEPELLAWLPSLPELAQGYALRDESSANFIRRENRLRWPLELTRLLFEQLNFTALLEQPAQMRLLGTLLPHLPRHDLTAELLLHLRAALQTASPALLTRHRSEVANLLLALLPSRTINLPAEGMSPELVQRLTQARVSVLLVPNGYAAQPDPKRLTAADAQALLECIRDAEDIAPVLRFLSRQMQDPAALEELTEDRPLLPTLLGSAGTGPWLTPRQAKEHAEQARIFRHQRDDAALLGHLQDVLGDEPLYLVESRVVDALDLGSIPRLSTAAALLTVRQAKNIGPVSARLALLQRLMEASTTITDRVENREVLRLLLHGEVAHTSDLDTPLLIGDGKKDVWWRVASLSSAHSPLGWSVVTERVDFLTPRSMAQLRVVRSDASSLTTLLAAAPHTFPGSALTADERRQVILELDDSLLKQLPVFETQARHLTAISPGVHVAGGFPVNGALEQRVTLLTLPEDDQPLRRRLERLAPPLSPVHVWEYLQNEPQPWKHWQVLGEALRAYRGGVLPHRAAELPWWPLKEGGGVAPKDVLFLVKHPESRGEIQRLRQASGKDLRVQDDLLPEFVELLGAEGSRLLAAEDRQRERLAELATSAKPYFVGSVSEPAQIWLRAFDGSPPEDLPLLGLLRAFADSREMQELLLRSAARPVAAAQVVRQLKFLHQQAVGADDPDLRVAAVAVFPALLADLRDQRQSAEVLTSLHLLNARGEWRKVDDLTRHGAQLDPHFVLCAEHTLALYGPDAQEQGQLPVQSSPPGQVPPMTALVNGVQALRSHLRDWETTAVPREQLGAFLGLLDGNPKLHAAAEGYLANFNLNVLREQALRDVPRDKLPHGFDSYQEMLGRTRLLITVSKGEHRTVPNLLGDPLQVPFKDDASLTSIFTKKHDARPFQFEGAFIYPVDLKLVDLKRPDLDLSTLLFESLKWVLEQYHRFTPPQLHQEFSRVVDSSQTTVAATQQRLIKAASQTWGRQLGIDRTSRVRDILNAIDQADRTAEQARALRTGETERMAERQIRALQDELKGLVESDPVTQRALLSGVCKKVAEMQYVPDSVPFELLQNADDALQELQEMVGDIDERRQTFTLDLSSKALRISHWGRPVNFFSYADFDGKRRGFDGDLEKMLTLMSSDKEAGVTGKFGLGFKSVFLLSEQPTVKSGRLAFTVKGGVYPVVPDEEHVQKMRAYLERVSPPGLLDGTLVELPLGSPEAAVAAVQRFIDLAPLALAFTRAIRKFQIIEGSKKQRVVWHETPLSAQVSAVQSQVSTGKGFRGLSLHSPAVKLLLALDDQGFTTLPAGTPNIWVTGPTGEVLGLPFLVNAAFPLDPGRAQLARNESLVTALIQTLIPELHAAFVSLLSGSIPPEQLASTLGAAVSTKALLARGLWKTLALPLARDNDAPAYLTLRSLLWGTGGAYGALTLEDEVVPSGLPGAYQTLIRVGNPGLSTVDFSSTALALLSKQAAFRKAFPAGTLVAEDVARTLQALGLPAPQRTVTLLQVLQLLLVNQQITPTAAAWLSAVLTEDALKSLREDAATAEWLGTLTFLAQDGHYAPAQTLLIGLAQQASDEAARFPFAPDAAKLSEQYDAAALTLFRRLRGDAPAAQTVPWIVAAQGGARLAALQYVAALGATHSVAVSLRGQVAGSWLEYSRLILTGEWAQLGEDQQTDVLNVLRQLKKAAPMVAEAVADFGADDEAEFEEFITPAAMPADMLQRLGEWWRREGPGAVRRYNERLYPSGVPFVTSSDFDAEDPTHRQRWLSLLMLGSFQSMGRTQPGAHRNFLRLCQEQGWLERFSQDGASDERWMTTVREYLGGNPEVLQYYQWMRGFIGFYQLGQWLPEYVEVLLGLNHLRDGQTLRTILAPNVNPALQGSGLSAPPLTRTLGIGGPFVIRELLRHHVLTHENLHGLAYVPTRRVRLMMGELMGRTLPDEAHEENSRLIHTHLVQRLGSRAAIFGGDFDLPLQALAGTGRDDAEAAALQRALLGRPLFGIHQ